MNKGMGLPFTGVNDLVEKIDTEATQACGRLSRRTSLNLGQIWNHPASRSQIGT
jgi:hypothetical protein